MIRRRRYRRTCTCDGPTTILAPPAPKLIPRRWLTWDFVQCAAAGGQVPRDIQAFLPWNLSDEKKNELRDTGLSEGDETS